MDQTQLLFIVAALLVAFFILRPLLLGGRRVNPDEAAQRVAAGTAVLIDVREPTEWTSGVAKPATLLPLSDFQGARKQWKPFLEKNRGKELILYCASGMRSGRVASKLKGEGFTTANLGGFHRWSSAGLPTRQP